MNSTQFVSNEKESVLDKDNKNNTFVRKSDSTLSPKMQMALQLGLASYHDLLIALRDS